MHDEWPDYLYDAGEAATSTLRPDTTERWNRRCLTAALEHLSQRREQVKALRRWAVLWAALALAEAGVLLGLLLLYLNG